MREIFDLDYAFMKMVMDDQSEEDTADDSTLETMKLMMTNGTISFADVKEQLENSDEERIVLTSQTKEERTSRDVYAGCLDGCGGASGSGSAEAAKMLSDIAFQPPMKSNPSRTYFYSRTVDTPNWSMTLNNSPINPPIIGKPAALDTYWLCISLKSAVDDSVIHLSVSPCTCLP